jgi:membrane protein YdbS with pleckstrin-like domain
VTASATEAADAPSETLADGVRRHLDPRWVTVQRIHAAIQVAVVSAVGVITLWITSGSWLAGLLLVLPWMLLSAAVAWQTYRWPPIAYRFASYRVDGDGLEIARGVHWQTITNVPRSRVQHTDVSQGPIERRFGLGTLIVYTAGTEHSRVTLPGLDFTMARRLRTQLLPGGQNDAV